MGCVMLQLNCLLMIFKCLFRSLNTHSIHGPVINPAYLYPYEGVQPEERVAGGSSGGSAAAVAAGLCDA